MQVMNKNPDRNKKIFGTVALLSAAIVWGLAFVFQHTSMESIGPFTFTGIRIGLGAFSVRIVQLIAEKGEILNYDRKTLKAGLLCGILTFGVMTFQQIGIVNTAPGKAGFITALYIMLVPVFGVIFFNRKESIKTWIGVVIGVSGLYLLCVEPHAGIINRSDFIIMGCSVCFAFHVLVVDRYCDGVNPLAVNFLQLAITSFLSLNCAVVFEQPTFEQVKLSIVPILYCGIVSAGFGYTLQLIGQKYVKPTVASLLMSLESVFGVIFGYLVLNDILTLRELLGCGIMFVAIVLIQIPSKGEMKLHEDNINKLV